MKKRLFTFVLAVVMLLGIVPIQALASTNYNGGWAMSAARQTVYNAASGGSSIGTIFKNEGITVLWTSGSVAYIEYSTSSGTKSGYLYNPNLQFSTENNSVARVTANTSVYYGESSSAYQRVGSVYAGEFVTVQGVENGWAYIEYNTSSGRKRGYMPESNLEIYYWGRLGAFDFKMYGVSYYTMPTAQTVYAGPSTQYPSVGSVSAGEAVYKGMGYIDSSGNHYMYVEYYVSGTSVKKSGFILL